MLTVDGISSLNPTEPRWNVTLLQRLAAVPPHILYMMLAGLSCIMLVFVTPPFQVPDEGAHFYRSYEIATGRFMGQSLNGLSGDFLPSSLPELVEYYLGSREVYAYPEVTPRPLSEIWKPFGQALEPERVEFIAFPNSVVLGPIGYFPQALGMKVGLLFDASPLSLLYAGRLSNVLFAIALITFAIRLLPIGKVAAMVFATLPMAQYEYASLAPDPTLISWGFLTTALALVIARKGRWGLGETALLTGAGMILTWIKFVYIPLPFAGLFSIVRWNSTEGFSIAPNWRRMLLLHLAMALILLGVAALWLNAVSGLVIPLSALMRDWDRTDVSDQIAFISANPFYFAWIMLSSMISSAYRYLHQGIGDFGWLNVRMYAVAYFACSGAIILSLLSRSADSSKGNLRLTVWGSVVLLTTWVLIEVALYLSWTPVGATQILGVQGRYFLPMLALAAAAFSFRLPSERIRQSNLYAVAFGLMVFSTLLMHVRLVQAYYAGF